MEHSDQNQDDKKHKRVEKEDHEGDYWEQFNFPIKEFIILICQYKTK